MFRECFEFVLKSWHIEKHPVIDSVKKNLDMFSWQKKSSIRANFSGRGNPIFVFTPSDTLPRPPWQRTPKTASFSKTVKTAWISKKTSSFFCIFRLVVKMFFSKSENSNSPRESSLSGRRSWHDSPHRVSFSSHPFPLALHLFGYVFIVYMYINL